MSLCSLKSNKKIFKDSNLDKKLAEEENFDTQSIDNDKNPKRAKKKQIDANFVLLNDSVQCAVCTMNFKNQDNFLQESGLSRKFLTLQDFHRDIDIG